MAENKCKSDAFSRFPSSAFIERNNGGDECDNIAV